MGHISPSNNDRAIIVDVLGVKKKIVFNGNCCSPCCEFYYWNFLYYVNHKCAIFHTDTLDSERSKDCIKLTEKEKL